MLFLRLGRALVGLVPVSYNQAKACTPCSSGRGRAMEGLVPVSYNKLGPVLHALRRQLTPRCEAHHDVELRCKLADARTGIGAKSTITDARAFGSLSLQHKIVRVAR